MSLLKGTIYITDKEDIIYNLPYSSNTKVISLDEDGVLAKNASTLVGTCLLPPIEAKIAEVDGNEQLYDTIYCNHLLEPYQRDFIGVIISCLYKGINLILFLPELGYTNTTDKLIFLIFKLYGIHIGFIGAQDPRIANCYYDETCVPMWLNSMYILSILSPLEYLYLYPINAMFTDKGIMNKLIDELKPYGTCYNDQINYIIRFHKKIHVKPNSRPAIYTKYSIDT